MNVCRIAILVVAYIVYSDAQCVIGPLCQFISVGGVVACSTVCSNVGYTGGYCDTSIWPPTFSCNCDGTRTVNPITDGLLNVYNTTLPFGCSAGCVSCGMTFNSFNYTPDQFTCTCT